MILNSGDPRDTEAKAKQLFLEALTCQEHGDLNRAEQYYREALILAPGRSSIQFNLSVVLYQLQHTDEALRLCETLVAAEPQNAAAQNHFGNCLARRGFLDRALQAYTQALCLQPDYVDALSNRGNSLFKAGCFIEALADYDHALRMNPNHAAAHYNRGRVLRELQRPEDALHCYENVKRLQAVFPDLEYDIGNVLLDLGRLQEAEASFQRAMEKQPGRSALWNALGVLKQERGSIVESRACYEQALVLDPGSSEARYNAACLRLLSREFDRAWPDYECRFDVPGSRLTLRRDPQSLKLFESRPRWRGPHDSGGDKVAIWAEQGIGDQLLFSTLLPELIKTCRSLVYEVDPRLLGAYQRAFKEVRFVALSEPPALELRRAESVLMAGSLPGKFRQALTDFERQPQQLLRALPDRVAHYQELLRSTAAQLHVAMSWRSTRHGRLGRTKSAPLDAFSPLLQLPSVQFVDLQYGDTAIERAELLQRHGSHMVHFDGVDYFQDLEEVLAIIEACDLLITTSNANAHLAGVLGKPVWLLNTAAVTPFHYWAQTDDHRCLWYPSIEIVSAPELPDWPSLVRFVIPRILRMVASRK
jgi:tetratricopeptide (TPR) repeat protein